MSKARDLGSLAVRYSYLDTIDDSDILNDLSDDLSPELGGDLNTNGNNIILGDNDKVIFGAGSDLQIYHDGSNSYINDAGTGDLIIYGANLRLGAAGTGEQFLRAYSNDRVDIYYDNLVKLATTSTGINVTGTVTADGLTVDGGGTLRLNASSQMTFLLLNKQALL